MSVKRQLRRGAVAIAAVAVFGLPADGQAQSVNMTASMSAECMGGCDMVRFTLGLSPADAFVDLARLFATSSSPWTFASLSGVQNKNFVDQGWSSDIFNGGLSLRGAGQFAAEPLYIYVNMASWGTQAQLYDGSLSFTGQGNTQQDGRGTDISYGGTVAATQVVPEPASMLLLGTGLAGVVGAARRRRRNDSV